jgi:N-acetylneuraminic acid mutarotase
MRDLGERFRVLDRLEPTALEREVARRSVLPESVPAPLRPRNRLAAGLVAASVTAIAVFAWSALRPLGEDARNDTAQTPASDAWSWAGEGWTELPAPPEWRDGAAIVWTGSELLYWGGRDASDRAVADGYAFDPADESWSRVPEAPSSASGMDAVWTGDEALFFDVAQGRPSSAVLAFDPSIERWRSLAPSPHAPEWGGASAWTGSELVVAGGGGSGSAETRQAYALDPIDDSWRPLPDMPIAVNLADATWTGSEIVVLGSEIDRRNNASTRTSVAAAYNPQTNAWRRLSDPPVSAQTAAISWAGERLVAWEGYSPAAAEFLPAEERWRSIDTGDVEGGECYAQGATVRSTILTWGCGAPAAWFTDTSTWARIERPVGADVDGITFSLGTVHEAGPVAVVEHVETVLLNGEPYIGSPDAPRHLWAWRPPSESIEPAPPSTLAAENLVGTFLSDWEPGWEPYLPTRASADVLEIMREGSTGIPSFEEGAIRNWRTGPAESLEQGRHLVPVDVIRDHEVIASLIFTVGPGTTADGRKGQLVIVDVRATD